MKSKAVVDTSGQEYFPDIVVLRLGTERPVMLVEVETESTVTPEEAKEWEQFSKLGGRFYLYVPRGYGLRAVELSKGFKADQLFEYWEEGEHYSLQRYA